MAGKIIKKVVLIFFVLTLAACAVPGTYMGASEVAQANLIPINATIISLQQPYEYRVGPYDVLNIIVWDHPELSLPVPVQTNIKSAQSIIAAAANNPSDTGILVNSNGKIFFPFAGSVFVKGFTVDQIHRKLTRRLARYIKNPQVSVRVSAFRSHEVNVIGEVVRPGTQALTDKPLTLLDAINAAGGINTVSADTGHIYVIRRGKKAARVYWIKARAPEQMLLAERFYLHNEDIVYVAPAGITSWNRIVSQILPTIQTVWYTHALTK